MGYEQLHPKNLREFCRHSSILENPTYIEAIEDGRITLALIRPDKGNNRFNLSDEEMSQKIVEEITSPLSIAASWTVQFTEQAVDEFYGNGPKERQQLAKPIHYPEYPTRWEEFVALMTSGPTTVLLLYSEDHKAVDNWRKLIGHWNIEGTIQPDTIRGKWGTDNYNNLVHGSDNPTAIKRELIIITSLNNSN